MIRKLLYRFRRQVLVCRVNWLGRSIKEEKYVSKVDQRTLDDFNLGLNQIIKLDATEMSKGEAHVVVR